MRNISIHCRYRWLLLCKCCVSYCFVFVVSDCKDSDYFHISKNYFTFLIKIYVRSLKIAVSHPKISGLKIAGYSLKIAGLKIIARVCVCVCGWVRGCVGAWVRSHFAEVSKIVQDAPGAKEHKHQGDHRNKSSTSEHKHRSRSTRAPNTKKKIKIQ